MIFAPYLEQVRQLEKAGLVPADGLLQERCNACVPDVRAAVNQHMPVIAAARVFDELCGSVGGCVERVVNVSRQFRTEIMVVL
jgi:hypothetical protein